MYCFCDDSGKESDLNNQVVVIAGYLFPENDALAIFENLWRAQLLREGISWLHMKDFMQDSDEYKQFSDRWPDKNVRWAKKKDMLAEFIKIIKITKPIGFGIGIDAVAWRKIPKSIQKLEGDAQAFCFTRIIRMVVDRMATAAPFNSVNLVFDCDMGFASPRFTRYIGIRDHVPNARKYLEAFTIAEPKRYLQLQAADLLAWETRKGMERKTKGLASRPEFDEFFSEVIGIFPEYVGEEWDAIAIQEKLVDPMMATGNYAPDDPIA